MIGLIYNLISGIKAFSLIQQMALKHQDLRFPLILYTFNIKRLINNNLIIVTKYL